MRRDGGGGGEECWVELWRDKKPDSPEGTAEVLKEFHGGEVRVGGEGDELGTGTLGGNESASAASWLNGSGGRENSRHVLMNLPTHSWKTVDVVTAGWSINLRGGLDGFHRERNIMGSAVRRGGSPSLPPPHQRGEVPAPLSVSDLSLDTCCWSIEATLMNFRSIYGCFSASDVSLGSRSTSRRL